MAGKTIALLHPGEMGAALGACLKAAGHRVVWSSERRSDATRSRAAAFEERGTLEAALADADAAFSVCPPHGATALARAVAAARYRGTFVDCNAIAPETARKVCAIVEAAGAGFVDGGIVGPPPVQAGRTRLFLSGARAAQTAALFAGTALEAHALDAPAGAASALKACYAAWTKGATALLAAIRALARHEGVEAALLEEWRRSQPELPKRSETVTVQARKAWRWVGEMEEIATAFRAAGLPEGFHLASAELYRALERFKDAGRDPTLDEVTAAVARSKARSRDA
jgi:3-hydroxyisobutyrate dehydrogenase-like beta-hydroxyacid dehydrogenase